MSKKHRNRFLSVFVYFATITVLIGGIAYPDSKSKHDEVLKHRQSRDILSFETILKILRPQINGEIIETEFEVENGIPVYEFKYISKSGRVREMYVDARTGDIIRGKID